MSNVAMRSIMAMSLCGSPRADKAVLSDCNSLLAVALCATLEGGTRAMAVLVAAKVGEPDSVVAPGVAEVVVGAVAFAGAFCGTALAVELPAAELPVVELLVARAVAAGIVAADADAFVAAAGVAALPELLPEVFPAVVAFPAPVFGPAFDAGLLAVPEALPRKNLAAALKSDEEFTLNSPAACAEASAAGACVDEVKSSVVA